MRVRITAAGPEDFADYGRIPSAFKVHSIFRVAADQFGFRLVEVPVRRTWTKDYDRRVGPDGVVAHWARSFRLDRWAFFIARLGRQPVGACAVVADSPELHILEGRRDLAVLWDLRVAPDVRGQGIGRRLFRRACAWAHGQGCRRLKTETQNVNVPACRFYARMGCVLGGINRFHYTGREQNEAMLLWYYPVRCCAAAVIRESARGMTWSESDSAAAGPERRTRH